MQLKNLALKCWQHKQPLLDPGLQFSKAVEILKAHAQKTPCTTFSAQCLNHGKECRFSAQPDAQTLIMNVSGPSCQDFSLMGKQSRFLGPTNDALLQFLYERLMLQEHVILVENVLRFQPDVIAKALGPQYDMKTLRVSPELLGWPIHRQRLYMVFIRKNTLSWRLEEDVQTAFERMFAREMHLTGDALMRAPPEAVQAAQDLVREKRGLPCIHSSGKPWSAFQLLSKGAQQKVREHESLAEAKYGKRAAVVVNIAQGVSWSPRVDGLPSSPDPQLCIVVGETPTSRTG